MNQFTRLTPIDLPTLVANLHRNAVGFDHMFNTLHDHFQFQNSDKYPPHDIVKLGDTNYAINVAVAGFKEDELNVTLENNVLTVSGEQTREINEGDTTSKKVEYLHRGISSKSFQREFNLAEHAVVSGAKYEHGLLTVFVDIEIPETMKPRKIEIASPNKAIGISAGGMMV